jgi:hypothetical protein
MNKRPFFTKRDTSPPRMSITSAGVHWDGTQLEYRHTIKLQSLESLSTTVIE